MLHRLHIPIVAVFLISLVILRCSSKNSKSIDKDNNGRELGLKYATGFSVTKYEDYKILTIKKPWPNSTNTYTYVLTDSIGAKNLKINENDVDGIITRTIEKLVVTSTTHIPSLELLEAENMLAGFPGTDYISSQRTRNRIESGLIRELGKNESINTEVLLEINPNVVIGFGVDGINRTFETVKKAGIPVIYNGDWAENSPLAKAEWIKFFGVLLNKEKEADSIFSKIEQDYIRAKQLAKKSESRPTVLSGAMHKDIWYLPNGSSPEAQLMKDANLNYLWENTSGNGSLALSVEVVLQKGQNADLWLSPSYYSSLNQLKESNSLYTNFEAFKEKRIYSFVNSQGPTGGILYYEMGTSRPDLVLKDLIKIGYPKLLEDYEPTFFKLLKD